MSYYFHKTIPGDFAAVVQKLKKELEKEGFGVLTEINIDETFKKKLDIDFRRYQILGACNPPFAYKALSAEDKIGTMLPCNVIVQETREGEVEVAAVNPVASMQAVENEKLNDIAMEVSKRLLRVVEKV
ncbi:DUF302 domain-containing protein [Christiangramia aestuarii]|uniref:DUF302 domain-containing protein n=1 Tax=Christiangramia aestuarii TaxID=1028746 RepID=A0A7K1LRQ6_9FLAO|nr:DUF302 domain-containing protein [Christiangramia aestuarii]MUP43492.1 DUF302 domain-containing protein [Christiangramia aestuarii]